MTDIVVHCTECGSMDTIFVEDVNAIRCLVCGKFSGRRIDDEEED